MTLLIHASLGGCAMPRRISRKVDPFTNGITM